jgi:hypothetical protein
MNKEEKEVVAVFGVTATLMAVVCILSFETCAIGTIIAITASLWAYVWSKVFGELLEEVRKQQIQSRNKPKCIADN